MKTILLITTFVISSMLSPASLYENNLLKKDFIEQTPNNSYQDNEATSQRKDCTVRVDFELEDGSTIQGEITFVDVSWWDCTQMQLFAWWKRNF